MSILHEVWPAWTYFLPIEIGPPITPDEVIPDTSDDEQPFEPTPEDLADYHAWSEELDRRNQDLDDAHVEDAYREFAWQALLEQSARFTDTDLQAAGLPVG